MHYDFDSEVRSIGIAAGVAGVCIILFTFFAGYLIGSN